MNRQLSDILNQPRSLARAIEHQFGYGAAALGKSAGVLRRARNVLFTGMGSSLFAAIPAVHLLNNAGIPAQAVAASELLYFGRSLIQSSTALVLISRSGDSVEVTKLLPVVRDAGAEAIGITNIVESTLARELPNRILIGSEPDQMVAIQTYTATVVVLLMLAMQSAGQPAAPAQMKALLEQTQQTIDAELNRRDEWLEFLTNAAVVYLLGRGPSMASVHEAALIFNEAARTPSVAMCAAQFRHGPVEILDERFRAVVFASQPATLHLDRALAADLTGLGAGIKTVATGPDASPFQPVLEIIPLQLAVCRLGERKGITPGGFRYAGQVTTGETGFRA